MKIRVSKYLVGATLCMVTHHSQAANDFTKYEGINALTTIEQKQFAMSALTNIETNNKINHSGVSTYKPVPGKENPTLGEILIKKLSSKKKDDVEDALRQILRLPKESASTLASKTLERKALVEIFTGLKINNNVQNLTAIRTENKKEQIKDICDKLNEEIKADTAISTYAINTQETTVQQVKNAGGTLANEKEIFHDKDSKVIAEYTEDILDLKTSSNKISSEQIPGEKLQELIKAEKGTEYKFFHENETETILDYIIKQMNGQAPLKATVKTILTTLHDTNLNDTTDAGTAIREYLQIEYNLKPTILDVFKSIDYKLTADTTLDKHLEAIIKKGKIKIEDYKIGYEADNGTKKEVDRLKLLGICDTQILDTKFSSQNVDAQKKELLTRLDQNLMMQKIDELEAQAVEEKNKTNEEAKKTKQLTKDKEKINKELEKAKKELKNQADEIETYSQCINDMLNALELEDQEDVVQNIVLIQEKMVELQNGAPAGAESVPQITALKEEIKALKRRNAELIIENKDLELKNALGGGNKGEITKLQNEYKKLKETNETLTNEITTLRAGKGITKETIAEILGKLRDENKNNTNVKTAIKWIEAALNEAIKNIAKPVPTKNAE